MTSQHKYLFPLPPHQPSSPKASNLLVPFQLMLVMVPSICSLRPGGSGLHGHTSSPLHTRTTSVGDLLDHRVKGLLKKLTAEKLDSISVKTITNISEKEKECCTLTEVIRLVFDRSGGVV